MPATTEVNKKVTLNFNGKGDAARAAVAEVRSEVNKLSETTAGAAKSMMTWENTRKAIGGGMRVLAEVLNATNRSWEDEIKSATRGAAEALVTGDYFKLAAIGIGMAAKAVDDFLINTENLSSALNDIQKQVKDAVETHKQAVEDSVKAYVTTTERGNKVLINRLEIVTGETEATKAYFDEVNRVGEVMGAKEVPAVTRSTVAHREHTTVLAGEFKIKQRLIDEAVAYIKAMDASAIAAENAMRKALYSEAAISMRERRQSMMAGVNWSPGAGPNREERLSGPSAELGQQLDQWHNLTAALGDYDTELQKLGMQTFQSFAQSADAAFAQVFAGQKSLGGGMKELLKATLMTLSTEMAARAVLALGAYAASYFTAVPQLVAFGIYSAGAATFGGLAGLAGAGGSGGARAAGGYGGGYGAGGRNTSGYESGSTTVNNNFYIGAGAASVMIGDPAAVGRAVSDALQAAEDRGYLPVKAAARRAR